MTQAATMTEQLRGEVLRIMDDYPFCRIPPTAVDEITNAAIAALQGSAALPSEDDRDCPVCNGDCGGANPPVLNCPMRAATPTAPVQDDDAEWLREMAQSFGPGPSLGHDRLERIASRLSPTPDTGLIEALRHAKGRFLNINICLSSGGTKREAIEIADVGEDCIKMTLERVANASPAQVESGK